MLLHTPPPVSPFFVCVLLVGLHSLFLGMFRLAFLCRSSLLRETNEREPITVRSQAASKFLHTHNLTLHDVRIPSFRTVPDFLSSFQAGEARVAAAAARVAAAAAAGGAAMPESL